MPFSLPPLPYEPLALEPRFDRRTMEIHHGKHHRTYVDRLNDAVANTPLAEKSVAELVARLGDAPEEIRQAVRNNGGGHLNHSLWWPSLTADRTSPSGGLGQAIRQDIGDLNTLRGQLSTAAAGVFGSGWAWLVFNGASLEVAATSNQDSPLSDGSVPLLGVDVWEHAYYLNCQNRRPDYPQEWWELIDWAEVGKRYERATAVGPDDAGWPVDAVTDLS